MSTNIKARVVVRGKVRLAYVQRETAKRLLVLVRYLHGGTEETWVHKAPIEDVEAQRMTKIGAVL